MSVKQIIPVLLPVRVGQFKLLSRPSFLPEGFVGIGIPIGTDSVCMIQYFVTETCRVIIDVEKLDDTLWRNMEDVFVHY
jgi:hypothetical protein